MRICFKEVGQGDSIILEWIIDDKKRAAVIDANLKKDNSNPTLNYLRSENISGIEFILLTHPHTDHFSGIIDILEYCKAGKIPIKYFLHTSFTIPECLERSVHGDTARSELARLFKTVIALEEEGVIQEVGFINSLTGDFPLTNEWKLCFLAPNSKAVRQFNDSKYKQILQSTDTSAILFGENNYAGNWLSTLLKIENSKGQFVLLTSDTVQRVFKWLQRDGLQELRSLLLIAQLPHHGAKSNYYDVFWKNLKFHPGTNSVISVGENSYGHPSPLVESSMKKLGYTILHTNKKEFITSPQSVLLGQYLDVISENQPSPKTKMISQDIWFDLEKVAQESALSIA